MAILPKDVDKAIEYATHNPNKDKDVADLSLAYLQLIRALAEANEKTP